MARLANLASGDAAGFVATLDRTVDDTLTADYWTITLPNELATSASKSPALLAYIAALEHPRRRSAAVDQHRAVSSRSGDHAEEGHRAPPPVPARPTCKVLGVDDVKTRQPDRQHGVRRLVRQHPDLRRPASHLLASTARPQVDHRPTARTSDVLARPARRLDHDALRRLPRRTTNTDGTGDTRRVPTAQRQGLPTRRTGHRATRRGRGGGAAQPVPPRRDRRTTAPAPNSTPRPPKPPPPATVLPDGRLYLDGETFDDLAELSTGGVLDRQRMDRMGGRPPRRKNSTRRTPRHGHRRPTRRPTMRSCSSAPSRFERRRFES